jgi:hypothetical protein
MNRIQIDFFNHYFVHFLSHKGKMLQANEIIKKDKAIPVTDNGDQ